MTCIAGIVCKNGDILMAADSAATTDCGDQKILKDRKIFINGPMCIGMVESIRMGQLLRYSLKIPDFPKGMSVSTFMSTLFINEVRRCFKEGGFGNSDPDDKAHTEGETGGFFLVGFEGRLFVIQNDYAVCESSTSYAAMGSGEPFALGSLHSTEKFADKISEKKRLTLALDAAATFSAYVAPPYRFIRFPNK